MKRLFQKRELQFEELLSIILKILKLVGLRLETKSFPKMWMNIFYSVYSGFTVFLYVFVHSLFSFLFVIFEDVPFESKINALATFIVFFELFLKICSISLNHEKIWSLLKEFKEMYEGIKVSQPKRSLIRTSIQINIWIVASLFGFLIVFISPAVGTMYTYFKTGSFVGSYPLDWWLPFEPTIYTYGFVYIFQFIVSGTSALFYIAIDSLILFILLLISWQFQEIAEEFCNSDSTSLNIKKLVKRHLSVIR